MKRVITDSSGSEIDINLCLSSKWYGCRTMVGAIYVLARLDGVQFAWFRLSTAGTGCAASVPFCDALESGKRVGEVFQFDSLAELGEWLIRPGCPRDHLEKNNASCGPTNS